MYLCICQSVSDRQIREAVALGDRTMGDLVIRLGVGMTCGKCIDSVRECLEACLTAPASASTPSPAAPVTAEAAPAPAEGDAAPQQRPAWFTIDL